VNGAGGGLEMGFYRKEGWERKGGIANKGVLPGGQPESMANQGKRRGRDTQGNFKRTVTTGKGKGLGVT